MGDTIMFSPNTGVNPTFIGRGSKIEHPDILPIFLGSYWPGASSVTVLALMDALRTMVSGAYLNGLRQYGYSGQAGVRVATIDQSPFIVTLPAAGPGVTQSSAVDAAVYNYINSQLKNDNIDNVDDNHDLIVIVFLDPANPVPVDTNSAGGQTFVTGSNSSLEQFEFLDDNTRFEWVWVNTAGSLATVTQTLSHELVEAITDPFNTGWHQTNPAPSPGGGQIGDVCNQPAVVDGVAVAAYWSQGDQKCVVTTAGTRGVFLSSTLSVHDPHDGPQQTGYMNFPMICGGGQYFHYTERTYRNVLNVSANVQGYESPIVIFTINGQAVPLAVGQIPVDATWNIPRSNPLFPDVFHKPLQAELTTWKPSVGSGDLTISVGPEAGNVSLHITVNAVESFDNPASGGGTTNRSSVMDVDLLNQEIIWENLYYDVKKNCDRLEHLSAGGVGGVVGRPQPGDPPNLIDIITNAVSEQGPGRVDKLREAAHLVEASRPELANALKAMAQRVG